MTAGNYDSLINGIARTLSTVLLARGVEAREVNSIVRVCCIQICAEWGGGEKLWLPKTYKKGRDEMIHGAIQSGASITKAAQQAGCHPNTVRNVLTRQPRGFGSDDWVL